MYTVVHLVVRAHEVWWLYLLSLDDDAQAAGNDLAAKLHANERCKFWPACKNGDTCQYHHPTQPCKSVYAFCCTFC